MSDPVAPTPPTASAPPRQLGVFDGPECVRCGRREVWHPDGSCHVFGAPLPPPDPAGAASEERVFFPDSTPQATPMLLTGECVACGENWLADGMREHPCGDPKVAVTKLMERVASLRARLAESEDAIRTAAHLMSARLDGRSISESYVAGYRVLFAYLHDGLTPPEPS